MQYSIKYNPMYAIRPHNNLQKVYKGKVIQNLTSGEPILHSVLVDLQINLNLMPSTQLGLTIRIRIIFCERYIF